MKFLIIIGLSIFLIRCNHHLCPATAEVNKEAFKKYMRYIKDAARGHDRVFADDYKEAFLYLSLVTGIPSKADVGETFRYINRADYKSDMKLWRQWYKENQCQLTQQYVDSVYSRVGLIR